MRVASFALRVTGCGKKGHGAKSIVHRVRHHSMGGAGGFKELQE